MYQQVTIVGNLGNDPDLRYLKDGTAVGDFSVATNRKWDGGEETVWWKVTVWRGQAENCHEFLSKGRQVLVVGRIKPGDDGNPNIWTDKNGNPRASYELTASYVKFLSGGTKKEEESTEVPY